MRFGKTSSDRNWVTHEQSLRHAAATKRRHDSFMKNAPGALGETRVIEYKPTGLKQAIREAANACREHRTPERVAALDALFLQARAEGWAVSEMDRAAMSRNRAAPRLRILDARSASDG